jgi:hypothetical protein
VSVGTDEYGAVIISSDKVFRNGKAVGTDGVTCTADISDNPGGTEQIAVRLAC